MNGKLLLIGCISSLLVLFISCQKVELNQIQNLNNNQIGVIGHGGSGFISAENSLPPNSWSSITKAIDGYLADGVEVDIQLSLDSVVYLFHDRDMARATNCTGCLSQWSSQKLEACQYRTTQGIHFSTQGDLVLLERLFQLTQERPGTYLFLNDTFFADCFSLPTSMLSVYARKLSDLIIRYELTDYVIIESSNIAFIEQLRNYSTTLKIALLGQADDGIFDITSKYELWGVSLNYNEQIPDSFIESCHQRGLRVSLYGILRLRKDLVDAVNKSPDFIQTDNIPLLQQILEP